MALTLQFARVTPDYLERCRASALDTPGAAPGWNPPAADRLDTDWAMWGLLRCCRATEAGTALIALLDRALSGDTTVGFLDHDEVYDGFSDPPRMLTPAAVTDIARALDEVDLDALLARLPKDTEDAAAVCGLDPGFSGDVPAYLAGHFGALREFYRGASGGGQCVVVWAD